MDVEYVFMDGIKFGRKSITQQILMEIQTMKDDDSDDDYILTEIIKTLEKELR